MVDRLPARLPDWSGAERIANEIDVVALRLVVRSLIDMVFTDDTALLDSLGDSLESSLVTPLGILSDVYEDGDLVEMIVAARLVKRSAISHLSGVPTGLRMLIEALPDPVVAE
jgi:hypothetical protein